MTVLGKASVFFGVLALAFFVYCLVAGVEVHPAAFLVPFPQLSLMALDEYKKKKKKREPFENRYDGTWGNNVEYER